MISAAKAKLIHSLTRKKARLESGLFVAEGPKLVGELGSSFKCVYLAATREWIDSCYTGFSPEVQCVTREELCRASLQQSPQEVLALFRIPERECSMNIAGKELCLALDGVQDPGNLGTIVRIADWFGISHIFCSPETADVFNPKAIQATMGAAARVSLHYIDLKAGIESLPKGIPVYGTFMDGTDIYKSELSENGIIVMGNEGNGISPEIRQLVSKRIGIPSFPAGRPTSESLNVAVATAIVCSEFRRKTLR